MALQINNIHNSPYGTRAYSNFIKEKNILGAAIGVVMGSLISQIVKKIAKDIINPLSKGKVKQIKKNVNFKLYMGLVINFITTSYILFVLTKFIEN